MRPFLLAAALMMGTAPIHAETLRFAGPVSPLSFDPHATNDFTTVALVRQVYDSLLSLGPNMEPLPGLATEWQAVDDKTWRFTLRDGVKFHDGNTMTADDVAFSINRGRESGYYAGLFGKIEGATVSGPLTVDVTSSEPDPVLPTKMVRMFIMSKPWSEKHGLTEIPDLGANAEAFSVNNENGTGPMVLVSNQRDVKTVFNVFPGYWQERSGNVDMAEFVPISSGPTRIAALLSGEVDVVTDIPLQDIGRVEAGGMSINTVPQLLWTQLEMDGTREVALDTWDKQGNPLTENPFRKVEVRQAIAHAIDAQAIVDRILRGHARVLGESSIPQMGGYQADLDERWATDPAKAKELLASAGYPDGFRTQLNCPNERYVNSEDVCRAIATMLSRVGIDVSVKGMPWAEFAKMLVQGPNSSFHFIGVASVWDTQDSFLSIMMTRDAETKDGFFNWAQWTDPDFDAVANELRTAFEPARRNELYRDGLMLAKERVNAVYLYQNEIVWGSRQGVSGVMRPDSVLDLANFTVEGR
ncbi:ABC transporter substrate-binding protein [Falsirhodobacter sp. 1013]|uniref:ABC transporter substrate-binding protein n=1 Tax=Falsirhodobacter sp. 1013 TaxID=3417566 RepID=UPI003EBB992B